MNKELKIFSGEEANPVFKDNRHSFRDTTYMEVKADQLIEVAKHIAQNEHDHRIAMERAYALICEAHLISRNIKHWNEKVRNNHTSKWIHEVVENSPRNNKDQPIRTHLLVAFFKSKDRPTNETDASKQFNKWIKDKIREKDYSENIPWNPHISDSQLINDLNERGWLTWFHTPNGSGHLIAPTSTKPKKILKSKVKSEEHITKPYWNSTDVWWPIPNADEIKREKAQILTSNGSAFISSYTAEKKLEEFSKWLDLQALIQQTNPTSQKKRSRSKSKKFVSDKDKGAGRNSFGKYGSEK